MKRAHCDVFLAGCGPASLATLIWLEQTGALEPILRGHSAQQYSMVLADPAKRGLLGSGALGQYVSASNTSACMFALNVFRPRDVDAPLKPEPTHDPVEEPINSSISSSTSPRPPSTTPTTTALPPTTPLVGTISTPLTPTAPTIAPLKPKLLSSPLFEPLRNTQEAQKLIKKGVGFTRLCHVAPFFHRVMQTIIQQRFEAVGSKGLVLSETYVDQVVVRKDGKYDIHVRTLGMHGGPGAERIITTNKLILAMGGKARSAPSWMKKYVDQAEERNTGSSKKKRKR